MVRIPNRNIRSSRNQRAGLYFNISELLCQRLNMKGVCGPSRWAINQRPVLSKYGCALRIGRKKYVRFEGKQIRNWATVGSTNLSNNHLSDGKQLTVYVKAPILFFLIGGATAAVTFADQGLSNQPAITSRSDFYNCFATGQFCRGINVQILHYPITFIHHFGTLMHQV